MNNCPLLFQFFASPNCVNDFSQTDWQQFVWQAYKTGCVSRVLAYLEEHQLETQVPHSLVWHFTSAKRMKSAQQRDFTFTLSKLAKHLAAYKGDVILLKGAAYAVDTKGKVGQGRLFSDVDIYVDKTDLNTVEQVLVWSGWKYDEEKSDYDINYYRNWMHELPPLANSSVPLMLDLHHHLVPIISRQHFDMQKLAQQTIASEHERFRVLNPEAQLIHTALHMLTNDDMNNISRDLLDFLFIYRSHKSQAFDSRLLNLADESGTHNHVLRALNMLRLFFAEEMSAELSERIARRGNLEKWVDARYQQVFLSRVLDKDPGSNNISLFLMWLRAHYLKMPTWVLIKHGLYKFGSMFAKTSESSVKTEQ